MALPRNTTLFRQIAPRIIARLTEDFGLTDFQAAGFPGNFGVETGGFTQMQERNPTVKGSKGGLGWAQWTGMRNGTGRRWLFEKWLRQKSAKPDDFEANYGFLWRELTGSEKGALTALRKAKSVEEAVTIVMERYERPGIPHLDRRKEWGVLALDTYRKANALPPSRPAAAVPPEVATVEPRTAPTHWWERWLGVKPPAITLIGKLAPNGDPTLFRQQNRLLAAGYTEVGDPDGLWGVNTAAAVGLALAEQFPDVEAPDGWPMGDDVLAALAKLDKRKVATARATVTVQDLRDRGSTPIKAPVAMTTGGGLLTFLGIGKAIEETGIPEKITKATDQAGEIMSSIQTAISLAGTVFSFLFTYWWAIVPVFCLWYFVLPGIKYALEIRALVRQGSIRQTSL